MVLITRCCCWRSVRPGSFAAGFYTLILHTIILTGGAFNLNTVMETLPMLVLSLVMLGCSGCCVITSVLLLIGLCVDSRMLLVPWLISVFTTTLLDFLVSLYLLFEADFNRFLAVLFSIDLLFCALNAYCIVCVYSQYQEYIAGRGYPVARRHQSPQAEYHSSRCFLSGTARMTNDSAATNSSSISVVQSSVPTANNEVSIVSEDYQDRYRDGDSCEERETIIPNDSANLLNAVTTSTEKMVDPTESSFVSNGNENSDFAFSQILDFDTENDERALKD